MGIAISHDTHKALLDAIAEHLCFELDEEEIEAIITTYRYDADDHVTSDDEILAMEAEFHDCLYVDGKLYDKEDIETELDNLKEVLNGL